MKLICRFKTIYSFICTLLIQFGVRAQVNLVPNPSFESYTDCPYGYSLIDNDEYPSVEEWLKPTGGTSDYYNMCADIASAVNTPYAAPGFQEPNSGLAYAGLYTHYLTYDYREYIQAKLTSPLVAGKLYHIGFSVNAAVVNGLWGCGETTDDVGMYLSVERPEDISSTAHISVIPQLKNTEGIFLSDTAAWYFVDGNYIADGGEEWVTIGNFNTPVLTDHEEISGGGNNCVYLFVDDVFVMEAGLLPLTITDFTAELISQQGDSRVLIQWNTQTESNDCCFYVERTTDGHSYTPAGVIEAKGNSTGLLPYSFTDEDPEPGTDYYRIKQLNNSGDFFFSTVISVHIAEEMVAAYSFHNTIFIRNDSGHQIRCILYDLKGNIVNTTSLQQGSSQWQPETPAGLFVLILEDAGSGMQIANYKIMF